ncbi:hypothetical protein RB597_005326 [Gaeumannomyces tritici]
MLATLALAGASLSSLCSDPRRSTWASRFKMKFLVVSLFALVCGSAALATPANSSVSPSSGQHHPKPHHPHQPPDSGCKNGPKSRNCWGKHSIDTNYYETAPDTGVTREYWLSVEEGICNNDGYKRYCQTFNGSFPGPLIWANWGDNLVIHVTNNMKTNGTAIHWHGLHQRGSVEYDGVPGVTQCPIAPGKSLTYKFRVTQYGTTWYHSHFSLQYTEGLFGPMIFYGPTTANYDEDLGTLFLQDWDHDTAWHGWENVASKGAGPLPANGLINGTNTFDCKNSTDTNCVGGGKKFSATFKKGKKHLIRIINNSADAHFQFSIDGHSLTVVSNDLVPIKPFKTQSVRVSIGQRYDVIVEANAKPGDYWLRSGMSCVPGDTGALRERVTGIIRYDKKSKADPKTTSDVVVDETCSDEDPKKLVPHVALDVTHMGEIVQSDLGFKPNGTPAEGQNWFQWTLNNSSLVLDWHDPTLERIFDRQSIFPTKYNVIKAEPASYGPSKQWFTLVIQSNEIPLTHPIHLHGHDFWVLSQSKAKWDGTPRGFNTKNPARRDTAMLPAGGHLAIAFQLDNPGAWLVHCHIAWHAGQGLSLEFVESQGRIALGMPDHHVFQQTCREWDAVRNKMPFPQHDSGI